MISGRKGWILSAVLSATVALSASSAMAVKAVVLSGGGSPAGNHFSQYLQTKTLADHLRVAVPGTDVFFAAGNRPGVPSPLADVHRVITEGNSSRHVMLPGAIDGNRPATKREFLSRMSSTLPNTTRAGEAFLLFVSDHGMPNLNANGQYDMTFSNNCIDMWSVAQNGSSLQQLAWAERCLSRVDLQQLLLRSSRASTNVFVMSQCFSGGFHRMSVEASATEVRANPRICGFTAITEDTTASGCTPNVDGPGYKGYERYMTQQITGRDVVTGQRLRPARLSVRDAHEAASLEDITVDIPLSTSEYFLEKWAEILARPSTTERRETLEFNQAFADRSAGSDARFERQRRYVEATEMVVGRALPGQVALFRGGSPEQFRQAMAAQQNRQAVIDRRLEAMGGEQVRFLRVLIPAWENEVVKGRSAVLNENERRYESALLTWEKTGALENNLIVNLALMTPGNPAQAEELSVYEGGRVERRLQWAEQHSSPQLREAARGLRQIDQDANRLSEESFSLQVAHGLTRRVLVYRSALAAWRLLEKKQMQTALRDLHALRACEDVELR